MDKKEDMALILSMIMAGLSADAPTRRFICSEYAFTVSPNPDKVFVEELTTGETYGLGKLTRLESALLAQLATICLCYGLYEKEDKSDKES